MPPTPSPSPLCIYGCRKPESFVLLLWGTILTLLVNWGLRAVALHNFDILETAVIEALELILELRLVDSN